MTTLPLTSLVTLLVVLLLAFNGINVGRARGRYGVKAPATHGNELFERVFRVQMNTLEGAVALLPALWIYAVYIGDRGAATTGAVWLVARVWYAIAYQKDPGKRHPAYGLAFVALAGAWLGALYGVGRVLMH
jgi:glutathione S-transferase